MRTAIRNRLGIANLAIDAGLELLRGALRLLATAPDPAPEEDTLYSPARGGELNHRTGRFDDGTDAAGWYDRT